MRAPPGAVLRFAVLIPHRDCLKPLRTLSRRLFAAGFSGAFSFPQTAPLALLSRPLSRGELGDLAAALRENSAERGGIITAGSAAPVSLPFRGEGQDPWDFTLWGPRLDLAVPAVIPGAVYRFPFPVLCAALIRSGAEDGGTDTAGIEAATEGLLPFYFRAAAAANMSLTALESGEPGYSFAWKLGEPRWLPRPGKRPPKKGNPG
ncbi:MAG: hypothetical protein LBO80_00105 [Treponema sp.]|nr:hypothetical protein [Treponema sp.]